MVAVMCLAVADVGAAEDVVSLNALDTVGAIVVSVIDIAVAVVVEVAWLGV